MFGRVGNCQNGLFVSPVPCGRERSTVQRGRWLMSLWECTTHWPPRPPITPRNHTSSSCGLQTGASTSSRHRELGWETSRGPQFPTP